MLFGLTIMKGVPIMAVLITIPYFTIIIGFSYFLRIGNFKI